MQIVLVMFRTDGQRRSFSVHKDVTVLGRREDCDVRIPLKDISRKHCKLVRSDDGASVAVEDLGSSNGTFVNGQRVQVGALEAGDTLQIGPVAFVIQLDGVPQDDDLQLHTRSATASKGASRTSGKASHAAAEMNGSDNSANGAFDPEAFLGGPEDSAVGEALNGSELAHDIAADLDEAERD